MKVWYYVSLLGPITAGILTDIRSETEYVDNGMIDDAEKKALQMIA
jgi:hypothetical protein